MSRCLWHRLSAVERSGESRVRVANGILSTSARPLHVRGGNVRIACPIRESPGRGYAYLVARWSSRVLSVRNRQQHDGHERTGPQFRAVYLRVSLHIREGQSSSLQEWVLDRRVDMAVVYNQPPLDAFHVRPLCSEPMILIAPPNTKMPRGGFQIRDLAIARPWLIDSDQPSQMSSSRRCSTSRSMRHSPIAASQARKSTPDQTVQTRRITEA